MSTDMTGIYQQNLFSTITLITVSVPQENRYRVLSETLPWPDLAEIANKFRSQHVNINNGRLLDLRLHLGVYIAQAMNGWTDRESEEMVKYHAGVRVLCSLECSDKSIDHTSIADFRNILGPDGAEELNRVIVLHASAKGFTGTGICSSDTTVQEAPIAYPTEVGHLKNITEKLFGIGKNLKKGLSEKLEKIKKDAMDIFTEIRLFTRGKKEKAQEKKKELGKKLQEKVKRMFNIVNKSLKDVRVKTQKKYNQEMELYETMIDQIKQWMDTGFHPQGKILSLWNTTARAINRGKAANAIEFGRRWIVTRLERGYVIGRPCQKLGSDSDANISEEVITQFLEVFGEVPESFIYDRGGDGEKNHNFLKDVGVKNNCIFLKGKEKMDVGSKKYQEVKRERALSEASIAVLKGRRYGFNRPLAKSADSCITKGQISMVGANLNKMFHDIVLVSGMEIEMG